MTSFRILTLLAIVLQTLGSQVAHAVIFGGTDNRAVDTSGWQVGSGAVFNVPGRIAYWEGPPFGGGQHRSECRGDTKAFTDVLAAFAKIKASEKLLVVHDGVGQSFWLNMNRQPELEEKARIDWVFTAWKLANWEQARKFPADLRPPDVDPNAKEPTPQIDVYVGGLIDWDLVDVPDGIRVDDQRMAVHGFSTDDGRVFEGTLTDGKTSLPIPGRIELRQQKSKDGAVELAWTAVASAATDDEGHWSITNAPTGRVMLVAIAPGYADRVLGYERVGTQPSWSRHDGSLVEASSLSGRVTDAKGAPIEAATVYLTATTNDDGDKYTTGLKSRHTVNADGRFEIQGVPKGWATVWAGKAGFISRDGRTETIVPAEGIELVLTVAGEIDVEIDFQSYEDRGEKRPKGYIVQVAEAADAETKSSWGGSGNIDESAKRVFKNVPPGRYVLSGRPNPGSSAETTPPVTIDVRAGETSFVTLKAK